MINPTVGLNCVVCGMKQVNVVHDSPERRADPANPLAKKHADQGGEDYYTWAKVGFHEFVGGNDD